MRPEQRIAASLARDGISLPVARTKLPMASVAQRKGPSKYQVLKEKRQALEKKRLGEMSVDRKVGARFYKRMKRLQLMGWTFTEIAEYLRVKRSIVVFELWTYSYRETGE